ncbi:hypothetical protein KRZ98_07980 [Sphingobium sp. AS12]|uniref:hypothetical protein n=1 Tax=Sphingobium sp. AS12 TaxID=2849495 RepID=UPI001C319629|nr:hypothetical protein [Sphingobium sp. AS12]MBV2148221.1 hypothetical protein [Sphingobium sp. AS12]
MSSKGATIAHGIGANALGDPRAALAWLANFLGQRGECIPAMSIIMTVGLSRAPTPPKKEIQSLVSLPC